MKSNELLLFAHIGILSISAVMALRMGKQALTAFVAISMVLANLFVTKQIMLFGLNATTADALAVGSMIGLNLLQEFYTKEAAQKALFATFFCLLFYAGMSIIHMQYIPSSSDTMHHAFVPILSMAPGIVLGSFVIFFLSQLTDITLYALLKKSGSLLGMILRNYIAVGISHLMDTVLFSLWIFKLGVIINPLHVIVVSFSIKMIVVAIAVPIITSAAKLIKPQADTL